MHLRCFNVFYFKSSQNSEKILSITRSYLIPGKFPLNFGEYKLKKWLDDTYVFKFSSNLLSEDTDEYHWRI